MPSYLRTKAMVTAMEGHIFGSRLRILMRVNNEVLGAIRLWVEGTCTSCNRAYTAVHVLCTYYEEILRNRRCDRGYTTVCVCGGGGGGGGE